MTANIDKLKASTIIMEPLPCRSKLQSTSQHLLLLLLIFTCLSSRFFVEVVAFPLQDKLALKVFTRSHPFKNINFDRYTSYSSAISSSSSLNTVNSQICSYIELQVPSTSEGPPRQAISVEDLTPVINQHLLDSGLKQGTVTVISRHTTTAITINERESRLAKDMEKYFLELAPPDERSSSKEARHGVSYFHNDIDERPESEEEAERCRENGWNIDDKKELQRWRDQEPINAHSHLLSMLLGSSESIPVVDGKMVIGQWQSILLVDLDGPRSRSVGLQLMGFGDS